MDTKKIMSIIKRQEGLKLDFKQKLSLDFESGKKELAMNIVESIVTNGQEYVVDPDAIVKARTAVLENLSNDTATKTVSDSCKDFTGLLSYGENIVLKDEGISIVSDKIASFSDDFTDLTKLYSYSANIKADKTAIDGIDDRSRVVKTASSSQNIVYKLPRIVDFNVKAYYQDDEELAFYTSNDGLNWKKTSVTKQNIGKNGDWNVAEFVANNVSTSTDFLKIELLKSKNKYYTPQIGKVDIRYCDTPTKDLSQNSITYNAYNIREFTATLSFASPYEVEFYSSKNAKDWNKLEGSPHLIQSGSGIFKRVDLTCTEIPQNSNFIKMVFTNENIGDNVVQLSGMNIVCGYGEYESEYPQWSNKNGFKVSDIFADGINLSWDFAVSNQSPIANYVLFQDGVKVAQYENDEFATSLQLLKPNTTYLFELVAVNQLGKSSVVQQVKATTLNHLDVSEYVSVKQVSVTDIDGKPTESLVSGAEITANVALTNRGKSPQNVVIVAMISNEKGQMLNMNYLNALISGDVENEKHAIQIRIPQNISRCKLELLVWDSLETMNPLSSSIVFFEK
ncbi:MAG: fibronectin type III domain-containing protein [Oscillospiraceae bacterium]